MLESFQRSAGKISEYMGHLSQSFSSSVPIFSRFRCSLSIFACIILCIVGNKSCFSVKNRLAVIFFFETCQALLNLFLVHLQTVMIEVDEGERVRAECIKLFSLPMNERLLLKVKRNSNFRLSDDEFRKSLSSSLTCCIVGQMSLQARK